LENDEKEECFPPKPFIYLNKKRLYIKKKKKINIIINTFPIYIIFQSSRSNLRGFPKGIFIHSIIICIIFIFSIFFIIKWSKISSSNYRVIINNNNNNKSKRRRKSRGTNRMKNRRDSICKVELRYFDDMKIN
jgi:hypothetical protein